VEFNLRCRLSKITKPGLRRLFSIGHGCSSKDDISKKIPPKPGNGLIFKGLLLQKYGRIFWITNRK